MIDRDELAAWLRLIETPGVGRETARRLLAAFGSPQAVFEASRSARGAIAGTAAASARAAEHESVDALLALTWAWLRLTRPNRARSSHSATRATRPPCSKPPTLR